MKNTAGNYRSVKLEEGAKKDKKSLRVEVCGRLNWGIWLRREKSADLFGRASRRIDSVKLEEGAKKDKKSLRVEVCGRLNWGSWLRQEKERRLVRSRESANRLG